METTWASTFLRGALRVDRRRLDLPLGVVAAVLVIVPLVIGQAAGTETGGVYATLGALNLLLAIAANRRITRFPPLAVAAVANASAFALGTLVGAAGGWIEVPLVALGVGIILVGASWAGYDSIGLVTSVMYVIGIGLPGGSGPEALDRFALALVGGLWVLLGILVVGPTLLRREERRQAANPVGSPADTMPTPGPPPSVVSRLHVRYAILVALTTAAGCAIGLALGLPKDYWIMLTVICALRATFVSTFSATFLRIVGTTGGAVIALGLTLWITNSWTLVALVFVFMVALFATRWVNYGIYALFLTPAVILLLNVPYPGNWQFAIVRVIDTLIGGGLAISVATLWWLRNRLDRTGPPVSVAATPDG